VGGVLKVERFACIATGGSGGGFACHAATCAGARCLATHRLVITLSNDGGFSQVFESRT